MADGKVVIDTELNTEGVETGMQKVKTSLASIGKGISFVLASKALYAFGRQAISLASDLEEVQNVVNVSFGSMSYKMEDFAKTAIESFGMSELSAKNMASTFVSMARGMGQGLDYATDYALELTGRLGDIASFYNKTIDEVQTLGRAIYSGETEPLKAIGVIMNETSLDAYAMAKGYGQLYKDMDAADKLFVRQQYFLEKTSLAAGDFARTQEGWANQTKILSERWKEFMSIVGSGIIQVLTPALNMANTVMQGLIGGIKTFMSVLGVETEDAANGVSVATGAIGDYTDAANEAVKTTKKLSRGWDEIAVVNIGDENTQSMASSLEATYKYESAVKTAADITTNNGGEIARILTEIADSAARMYNGIKPFVEGFADGFISTMKQIAGIALDAFNLAFKVFADILGEMNADKIRTVGEVLGTLLAVWIGAKAVIGLTSFISTFAGAIGALGASLAANPILATFALAAGIVALFELFSSENKIEKNNVAKQIKDDVDAMAESLAEAEKKYSDNTLVGDLDSVYKAWDAIASKTGELTDSEKGLLISYAKKLKQLCPEVTPFIDENGKAFEGVSGAIADAIEKTKQYYRVQAAGSYLEELTKKELEAEDAVNRTADAVKNALANVKSASTVNGLAAYGTYGFSNLDFIEKARQLREFEKTTGSFGEAIKKLGLGENDYTKALRALGEAIDANESALDLQVEIKERINQVSAEYVNMQKSTTTETEKNTKATANLEDKFKSLAKSLDAMNGTNGKLTLTKTSLLESANAANTFLSAMTDLNNSGAINSVNVGTSTTKYAGTSVPSTVPFSSVSAAMSASGGIAGLSSKVDTLTNAVTNLANKNTVVEIDGKAVFNAVQKQQNKKSVAFGLY